MKTRGFGRLVLGVPSLVLLVISAQAIAIAGTGVTVALTPNMVEVAPGALFDLDITITESGSPFNGFNAVIGFDPAAVTCVPRAPLSEQEGQLFRDACSMRFHRFEQGAETDSIGDFLLCSGVTVAGPGQIYHLLFRASTTPQVTRIRFLEGLHFYSDGTYVTPLHATSAIVGIGLPPASADTVTPGPELRLRIAPNPARGAATITVESGGPDPGMIAVVDVDGRVVRRFMESSSTGPIRSVAWDGNDSMGRPLPTGVYFITYEVQGQSIADRISWIR
jgi:hypothetical protein